MLFLCSPPPSEFLKGCRFYNYLVVNGRNEFLDDQIDEVGLILRSLLSTKKSKRSADTKPCFRRTEVVCEGRNKEEMIPSLTRLPTAIEQTLTSINTGNRQVLRVHLVFVLLWHVDLAGVISRPAQLNLALKSPIIDLSSCAGILMQ